jgi:hypothetical protein
MCVYIKHQPYIFVQMYYFAPQTPEGREAFETEMLAELKQEYTPRACVDYPYQSNAKAPRSFCMIASEDEGLEWYREHHKEVPDDILRMMARHQFGKPPAPPPKKSASDNKPKFSIEQKLIELSFDD